MILSGLEIREEMNRGNISIDPFDEKRLNPNSYNLRLNKKLIVYQEEILDLKKPNNFTELMIPGEGMVLQPGELYLGRTEEYTKTNGFVPMLEGRSSIGRLGLSIHITAGFGDIGFKGFWTLEIHVIRPVRIYPLVEICQIYYHTIQGDFIPYKSGKYQGNTDIQPSMSWKDYT